jgi:hypothetical protein
MYNLALDNDSFRRAAEKAEKSGKKHYLLYRDNPLQLIKEMPYVGCSLTIDSDQDVNSNLLVRALKALGFKVADRETEEERHYDDEGDDEGEYSDEEFN